MAESKKIVFPGQPLTVEEEYEPGQNAYTDEEGNVVSSTAGIVSFDEDNREVHVKNAHHNAQGLEEGAIVIGKVSMVKDMVVLVAIGFAEKDGQRRHIYDTSGALNVSRATGQFVRSMHDLYKVGDFLRARVSNVTHFSVELSTNEKGLGKILAREKISQQENPSHETFPRITRKQWE